MTFAHPDAFVHAGIKRGLESARQIVRDPKGVHSDEIVLEACSYLMSHGDHLDYADAERVQQSIMSDLWARRRDQQEEEDGIGGLILLGFAVLGCAAYAIFGWPL